MDAQQLFKATPSDIHFGGETDYKRAWVDLVEIYESASSETRNLFALAFQGGVLADRLSFVFIAAYQAAVRHCFPAATGARFYCFAASEDRTGVLPAAAIRDGGLVGSKTWIATSACVDSIVATANGGCVLVDAASAGVSLEDGGPKNFLPDLSQGKAHFDNAKFEPVEMEGDFGLAEAFFVTCAATGYLAREAKAMGDQDSFNIAINYASALSALYGAGIDSDIELLTTTYHAVKELGKSIASRTVSEPRQTDWEQNGKLLGMYGRRLPQ